MPAETMIQCDGLTKRFGHFTTVDHVSFSVGKASIFSFPGRNRSGTSTVSQPIGSERVTQAHGDEDRTPEVQFDLASAEPMLVRAQALILCATE